MNAITDPELDLRLGVLDAAATERIREYATAAFLWRRLSQADALDVARGLHWRAVGRDLAAGAAEVVDALSLVPPLGSERARLAAVLTTHWQLDHAGPDATSPGTPRLDDLRRLGRRLSLALNLLDSARTIAS
ncbi:hypothetical protein EV188_102440 [Actinomycetospora succinea]|uniref:Uncharacterized protein n=1 Tax=Actinomycetospora succinea TaxID=663603 RepID=A0A4R6VLG0_9PSEU|nr:hypothetical protein [Actinomycetospora succinea]TDQ62785.1 hypothetical protein EV188_102440 [Actinomycetospora succinea]